MSNTPDEVVTQDGAAPMRPSAVAPGTRPVSDVTRRPVSNNYRPLGAITNQVPDRIHSIHDPQQSQGALGTYTFTACVNGTPKNFVIPIISGPT